MHPLHAFTQPLLDPSSQTAIIGVLAMILLDFAVGLGGALMTKTFSSKKMHEGLVKKYAELCAMALGIILDGVLAGGLELSIQPVLITTCIYIMAMETGSVLELIKKYNPDADGLVGRLTSLVQPKGGQDG